MKRNVLVKIIAVIIAIIMPIVTATICFAETGNQSAETYSSDTKYENPDINSLTGHGEEPEELSVSAGAEYLEKAWYEYVPYSEKAVSSYRLNDDQRILFYDPYTYTNSMIMDVQFDAKTTEFDTMSSYTVSHTNSKTIDSCVSSTDTYTSATQTSGKDVTHSDVENTGSTKTTYNHDVVNSTSGTVKDKKSFEYGEYKYTTTSSTLETISSSETNIKIGLEAGVEEKIVIGINGSDTINHDTAIVQKGETNETIYSPDYKTSTKETGKDTVEYDTASKTDGWTQLAARITKTTGSSSATSRGWSETEGTTITKTYAATHFASDGVTPLPWAIVHYNVQMPMKCCLQVKHSGEWITISTVYCLLTTVQGTCRAWMQNGQVYYEDWGNGEPVVATDFWSQFMTKEQLIKAYSDKLYPVGGEN